MFLLAVSRVVQPNILLLITQLLGCLSLADIYFSKTELNLEIKEWRDYLEFGIMTDRESELIELPSNIEHQLLELSLLIRLMIFFYITTFITNIASTQVNFLVPVHIFLLTIKCMTMFYLVGSSMIFQIIFNQMFTNLKSRNASFQV
ncbi:hypothetical protein RF11_10391 [Thelohanellus kitauei]|uniref:Uncharacterized protein n=1 Tax=Thelohanellus kitauei TaxID=669202 RepID=A0A0C2J4B6_THEKT|nr:hypothetical protein RF11_10391 [Thelohanellus kitauei]